VGFLAGFFNANPDQHPSVSAFVFAPSVFGEKCPTGEFLMIVSAETPCCEIERK
jgi:hypothetical protein